MEHKIQYHIDKFVAFLFGRENENDPEQIIYNRLLRLEGDELEVWMNEKVKKYINFIGFYFEFQGVEFEGIAGPFRFETWYNIHSMRENSELLLYQEIYDSSDPEYTHELQEIKLKLHKFQEQNSRNYDRDLHWRIHILTDYMEMFILSMNAEDLKSYIIEQVEPVEIR
jgi:hypothetical protein